MTEFVTNMTPQEERNQKLAEQMIKNLNRRNMEAFYCPTGKESVKVVSELITDGSTVTCISEDGVIVNIDGNGNRVAAITWGPKKVIFVIGLNKVAQTVEAALARARSIASPVNAQRFDIKTPCRIDGRCHNCNSPESICSQGAACCCACRRRFRLLRNGQ